MLKFNLISSKKSWLQFLFHGLESWCVYWDNWELAWPLWIYKGKIHLPGLCLACCSLVCISTLLVPAGNGNSRAFPQLLLALEEDITAPWGLFLSLNMSRCCKKANKFKNRPMCSWQPQKCPCSPQCKKSLEEWGVLTSGRWGITRCR